LAQIYHEILAGRGQWLLLDQSHERPRTFSSDTVRFRGGGHPDRDNYWADGSNISLGMDNAVSYVEFGIATSSGSTDGKQHPHNGFNNVSIYCGCAAPHHFTFCAATLGSRTAQASLAPPGCNWRLLHDWVSTVWLDITVARL
jgi:hypothetical protein